MKANWLSWLALLFAAAALIISFVFIGQAKDTTADLEVVIDAYNAAISELNEIVEDYNEVTQDYNRIVDDFNEILEDYWEWRAEQNDT